MKSEDGFNSGVRNIGRFFLSLIPWAIGIGALVWLGVWVGVAKYKHDVAKYKHDIEQQRRAATYVGAEERPKEKLKIEVIKKDCSTLIRADVNGRDLVMYAKNNCHEEISYLAWHWQSVSPDGTVIRSGYTNRCPIPRTHGEKAECKDEIVVDDRTSSIRLWTQTSP